jgi:hypothetical protein
MRFPGMSLDHVAVSARGSSSASDLAKFSRPIAPAVGFVAIGLFVMFGSFGIFTLHARWFIGSDVWTLLNGGLSIVWGNLPGSLRYVSSPGTAVLMVPPAFVIWHLRLIIPVFRKNEPSALLALGPYLLILGTSVNFAVDGLAKRLEIRAARRNALDVIIGAFAFPAVVLW